MLIDLLMGTSYRYRLDNSRLPDGEVTFPLVSELTSESQLTPLTTQSRYVISYKVISQVSLESEY